MPSPPESPVATQPSSPLAARTRPGAAALRVALIGTAPPTRCGIATFTSDVQATLSDRGIDAAVIPVVTHASASRDRPSWSEVVRDDPASYERAAEALEGRFDVVDVQHEFGIFGGERGEHIVRFAEALAVPMVVTLHTVLPEFDAKQRDVLRRLCARATSVVVFTDTAKALLREQGIATDISVDVIPHGAPVELFAPHDTLVSRERFGLPPTGRVMSTFGLLSRGKGLEMAISALACISQTHPDVRYVIAGRTHPDVLRREGESYRDELRAHAHQLGVGDRVHFVDRFMSTDEVAALLSVTDVFCTPYLGLDQIVSGALTFALAARCPVASTPYLYALDMLAGGAGVICELDDVQGYALVIGELLMPGSRRADAVAALDVIAPSLSWPVVGQAIEVVLRRAVRAATSFEPRDQASVSRGSTTRRALPATSHLRALCDDTGIFQHARLRIPRVEDGYCLDDAARALPIVTRLHAVTGDDEWLRIATRLLSFARQAIGDRGHVRNFMSWDRRWLDEPHDGDHVGRLVWGLGETVALGATHVDESSQLLADLQPALERCRSIREVAYASLGMAAAANVEPAFRPGLDVVQSLIHRWELGRDPAWPWPEPRLTYDNARIPEAMVRIGHVASDPTLVERGRLLLDWYEQLCRRGDHYRFPGNRWIQQGASTVGSGDEQPLEAVALADGFAALLVAGGDHRSAGLGPVVARCWSWYLGNNRLGVAVGDVASGSGSDGLGSHDLNRNCGAESTLAFVRCAFTNHDVFGTTCELPAGAPR